jgi:hypothetical protein
MSFIFRDEIQKLKREIEIKVKEKEALHNRYLQTDFMNKTMLLSITFA